jgi:hypothetical protein
MMFDAGRGCSHDVDQHDRLPTPSITYLFELPTFCFGQNRPASWVASIRTQDMLCMVRSKCTKIERLSLVGISVPAHTSWSPGFL